VVSEMNNTPRPQGTILVVDDDTDLREAVVEALRSEGYRVTAAKNGADALSHLRLERPALVLLDLMMPVMDGWRFRE
jgi:CheY-like chemotaxis protein